MKTFIISYITTSGLTTLNHVIRGNNRTEAIGELIGDEHIFIILSIIEVK
jgi:hypothetical protein